MTVTNAKTHAGRACLSIAGGAVLRCISPLSERGGDKGEREPSKQDRSERESLVTRHVACCCASEPLMRWNSISHTLPSSYPERIDYKAAVERRAETESESEKARHLQ